MAGSICKKFVSYRVGSTVELGRWNSRASYVTGVLQQALVTEVVAALPSSFWCNGRKVAIHNEALRRIGSLRLTVVVFSAVGTYRASYLTLSLTTGGIRQRARVWSTKCGSGRFASAGEVRLLSAAQRYVATWRYLRHV